MRTLVLVAHPNFESSSSQNFLRAGAQTLGEVRYRILDQIYPDFRIDVNEERRQLDWADQLIFQFPLYWYSAPASLKVWQDQVWQTADETHLPNYAGKTLGLVVTTGVAKKAFQAGGAEAFTLSEFLRPFEATARKLQFTYRPPFILDQFQYASESQKMTWLIQYQQLLTMTDTDFGAQQDWLVQRLRQLQVKSPDDTLLAGILGAIQMNQDDLADLQSALAMMKGDL